MAGSVWIKNTAGVWVEGKPYFKHETSGWLPGGTIYEKTDSTTWTTRYVGDSGPPGSPTLVNSANTTTMTYTATITAPADADVAQGCIKISTTGYPVNPGVEDENSKNQIQADGTEFWIYPTTPGAVSVRNLPSRVANTKYYISVWIKDTQGNWSAPTQSLYTFPNPPAPVKTLVTKTAYVDTTDSGAWRADQGWRTDSNYPYQGGPYAFQGFWFYGTKIAATLAKAHTITKIELYVQRVNSSHGVSGDANIMVGHHTLASQPSGPPGTNAVTGEYNTHDLARGEGKWATITSSWYSSFKSGAYRGFGIQYGTTSVTSAYYAYCYGKGTSSGRVKLTWTEYV